MFLPNRRAYGVLLSLALFLCAQVFAQTETFTLTEFPEPGLNRVILDIQDTADGIFIAEHQANNVSSISIYRYDYDSETGFPVNVPSAMYTIFASSDVYSLSMTDYDNNLYVLLSYDNGAFAEIFSIEISNMSGGSQLHSLAGYTRLGHVLLSDAGFVDGNLYLILQGGEYDYLIPPANLNNISYLPKSISNSEILSSFNDDSQVFWRIESDASSVAFTSFTVVPNSQFPSEIDSRVYADSNISAFSANEIGNLVFVREALTDSVSQITLQQTGYLLDDTSYIPNEAISLSYASDAVDVVVADTLSSILGFTIQQERIGDVFYHTSDTIILVYSNILYELDLTGGSVRKSIDITNQTVLFAIASPSGDMLYGVKSGPYHYSAFVVTHGQRSELVTLDTPINMSVAQMNMSRVFSLIESSRGNALVNIFLSSTQDSEINVYQPFFLETNGLLYLPTRSGGDS